MDKKLRKNLHVTIRIKIQETTLNIIDSNQGLTFLKTTLHWNIVMTFAIAVSQNELWVVFDSLV